MTVKQIAAQWGITEATVRRYCRNGYIHGAVKLGNKWRIPDNYPQPYISRKRKFSSPSEKSDYVLFAIESGKALDFSLLALEPEEFHRYARSLLESGNLERDGSGYRLTQSGMDRCDGLRAKRRREVREAITTAASVAGVVLPLLVA